MNQRNSEASHKGEVNSGKNFLFHNFLKTNTSGLEIRSYAFLI